MVIAAPGADAGWARAHGVRSGRNPGRPFGTESVQRRAAVRWIICACSIVTPPMFYLGFTAKPNIYGSLAARLAGVTSLPNVSGLGTAFISDGPLVPLRRPALPARLSRMPDRLLSESRRPRPVPRPQDRQAGAGPPAAGFGRRPRPVQRRRRRQATISCASCSSAGCSATRECGNSSRRRGCSRSNSRAGGSSCLVRSMKAIAAASKRMSFDRWIDEGIVEYLGEADDVRPHIAAATAVVLPSYREGLPRSLLEAAAMARPLVATDVPGNRQLVRAWREWPAVRGAQCTIAGRRHAANGDDGTGAARRDGPGWRGRWSSAAMARSASSTPISRRWRNWRPRRGFSHSMFHWRNNRTKRPAQTPRGYRAYAVGDVHGRLDLLDQLLGAIERDLERRPARKTLLIFLGDLIDRGPDSRGVVERLRTYRRDAMRALFPRRQS